MRQKTWVDGKLTTTKVALAEGPSRKPVAAVVKVGTKSRLRLATPDAGNTSGAGINLSNAAMWDRIAQCESGGNWSINTGNGYYGGLQFASARGWPTVATTSPRAPTWPRVRSRSPWPTATTPRRVSARGVARTQPDPGTRRRPAPRVCSRNPLRFTRPPWPCRVSATLSLHPKGGRGRVPRVGAWPTHRAAFLGAAEIRELAAELGIRPTKQWGQNFVIDANTVARSSGWPGSAPTTPWSRSARAWGR